MHSIVQTDRKAKTNYEVNEGQLQDLMFYGMSHDEESFPDAFKFILEPERSPDKVLPFEIGTRNCVAQRFVLLEMKLFIATILSRFKFQKY